MTMTHTTYQRIPDDPLAARLIREGEERLKAAATPPPPEPLTDFERSAMAQLQNVAHLQGPGNSGFGLCGSALSGLLGGLGAAPASYGIPGLPRRPPW